MKNWERNQHILNLILFVGAHSKCKKEKCPAWGKTCSACKERNHLKTKCMKVDSLEAEVDAEIYNYKSISASLHYVILSNNKSHNLTKM